MLCEVLDENFRRVAVAVASSLDVHKWGLNAAQAPSNDPLSTGGVDIDADLWGGLDGS